MRHLLAPEHMGVLDRVSHEDTLLVFDYDGALAPLPADSRGAQMRDETRRLLGLLTARRTCAIISGRARDDLVVRLQGLPPGLRASPLTEHAGEAMHLLLRSGSGPPAQEATLSPSLQLLYLTGLPITVASAEALLSSLEGARLVPPSRPPRRYSAVLHVGTSLTHDAMRLGRGSEDWLAVRVGHGDGADYYLRDQGEIDVLLRALLALRTDVVA